ncbi:aryl-sulfate sulfotransferase [bacterium]|nr:aryl-sulfate sulfotransferase [bacterium]
MKLFNAFLIYICSFLVFPATSLAIDIVLPNSMFEYESFSSDLAQEGYLYTSWVAGGLDAIHRRSFCVILDEDNEVVFFNQKKPDHQVLFTPLPSLDMIGITNKFESNYFLLYDYTFAFIDTVFAPPGLILDGHELIASDDSTFWYACWDDRQFDMSIYHPDAHEAAIVRFHAVVRQDLHGNIVWRWNSYDHVDELPMSDLVDTTRIFQWQLQHLHTNAIEITTEGDVIISNRRMSEIVKIDYSTGDVIWRWGGGTGNQFEFIGDAEIPLAFSQQHDIRILPNGNFTLFDNGVDHDTVVSYVREYHLDEENMTATLVWYYLNEPPVYGYRWGSTRRLVNGNTLIGWGGGGNNIDASEVTPEGQIVREIILENDFYTGGRPGGYRYSLSDRRIISEVPYLCEFQLGDGIDFYCNWFGHEEEVYAYNIYSVSPEGIRNRILTTHTGIFENYPVNPQGGYRYCIRAVDINGNEFGDYSNIVEIPAETDVDQFDISPIPLPHRTSISSIYPNPFNSLVTISCNLQSNQAAKLVVFNLLGEVVYEFPINSQSSGQHTITWDSNNLTSGTYLVRLTSGGRTDSRRIELLK